jgi:hypothetical protein
MSTEYNPMTDELGTCVNVVGKKLKCTQSYLYVKGS